MRDRTSDVYFVSDRLYNYSRLYQHLEWYIEDFTKSFLFLVTPYYLRLSTLLLYLTRRPELYIPPTCVRIFYLPGRTTSHLPLYPFYFSSIDFKPSFCCFTSI